MFKRLTTIAILAITLVASSATAGPQSETLGGEAPFARQRAASWSECSDCIPPVLDLILIRPIAAIPAATGLLAFVGFGPFVALSDPGYLGEFWHATAGGALGFIFLDRLGTH